MSLHSELGFAGGNLLPTEVERSITGCFLLKFSSKIRVLVDSNTKKNISVDSNTKKTNSSSRKICVLINVFLKFVFQLSL